MRFFPRLAAALVVLGGCAFADGLIPPLTPQQAEFARKSLAAFKENQRGPYQRIRWYCKDGSVLPPEGSCREKGGGFQHGELGPAAKQLATYGIHAGTILAGMPHEELLDAARDHHRLKQLVLEKYLVQVDHGWIYRKAVSYRGARQIEDEEQAGRDFLIRQFADSEWLARNYYLAQQLVDAVPHGLQDSAVKKIRNLAAVASDQDARFQPVRAKIHSYPGPEDLRLVRDFIKVKNPNEAAAKTLAELETLLEQKQNPANWVARMETVKAKLPAGAVATAIGNLGTAMREGGRDEALQSAAALTTAIRAQVQSSKNGRRNLELLDLNALLMEKAFEFRQPPPQAPRTQLLLRLRDQFELAAGAGLLSQRQLEVLSAETGAVILRKSASAEDYRASMRFLGRATEWCRATATRDFGPLVRHYQDAEPAAKPFLDQLLRASVALPMTQSLEVLLTDADRAVGLRHSVFGRESSAGVVGLNPGIAVGRLGVLEPGEEGGAIDPRGIYVIPETASDLKPMAGILTLDSGNLLSHAQLLAANLGIPNATIPSSLRADLEKQKGQEVFFAVTPKNVVVLKAKADLGAEEKKLWASQPAAGARARIPLDTSRLKIDDAALRRLYDVSMKDSGVICGPKAANLGQLAADFPGRVAGGLVIPFGVFRKHIARELDKSGKTLEQQISEAVAEVERLRETGAEPSAISGYMYPRLAEFRKTIQNMPLLPEFEKEVTAAMAKEFGADGTYGVFVRSDTNAEDLPEFTGAGLNLTVPNQVGVKNILTALRNVWASPFTERAFDWRNRALKGTDKVYPSVILMRAVPSDKSGVIATTDLETGDRNQTTVNASEGVSAVVDGGVAESLLLGPGGAIRMLQQCRATYRKTLKPTGGFVNLPPLGGDTLLTADEIVQLRKLVDDVYAKYGRDEQPWDIEFGFEKGQLRLFQIRPLVRFKELATLEALSKLETVSGTAKAVNMSEAPLR